MKRSLVALGSLWMLVASHSGVPRSQGAVVERWGCFEIVLNGPSADNPFVDVRLLADFSDGKRQLSVAGFYDGEGVYRIRFMPPAEGRWDYATRSNRDDLDGKRGSLEVGPALPGNHGPVGVAHRWHFAYADGAPYFQVGTTCYAWIHQSEELQRQTLETLSAAPFNKIRFCVFPKSYAYNRNEPALFAFQQRARGRFDFTRPDPAFWRHLERRIADLQKLGIEADLILWHPYDRWGFAEMGDENDDRYLRYCIARLGALRNVWWSLANEYDLMAPRTTAQGHRGDKTIEDWDRFFRILQQEDPYGHLRSIHNCRAFYDHAKPWVTHASIQHHELMKVSQWRAEFNKPIVVDECGYEGNVPQGWGKLTAQEMLRRFWIGTMCGGYVGHGETYLHPEDILWWSKGGVLHGRSPARIAFLKKIMGQVAFHEFTPQPEPSPGVCLLSHPRAGHFLYFTRAAKATVVLGGNQPYKLDGIDTWERKVLPLGTAPPGPCTVEAPNADYLVRLTAYAAGEKLRPPVKASISANEGVAPLAVRFRAEAPGSVRWDFGDGSTSDLRNPLHIYRAPGLYTATVVVTDPDDAEAAQVFGIAVEGDTSRPLVRAGFDSGETHPITLNGQVRRQSDGGFALAEGQSWGWANVGEGPIADLDGLRSLTICGWLEPSSLKVGAGGNRIAFCLNHRTSGFDLVHLADGRLRLSVNEWPDPVRNDSSPGKLAIGKWTFFAVTYDAAKPKDNVRWYFGGVGAPVELDRVSTYDAGSIGRGVGSLTVGNYNETMHGHGQDRQFRGEIRRLEIFGSRLGSRGALGPEYLEQRREEGIRCARPQDPNSAVQQ